MCIQSVTVPKMFNDTDTFFQYQIFPIPVPRLFSGTKFFHWNSRYRYVTLWIMLLYDDYDIQHMMIMTLYDDHDII